MESQIIVECVDTLIAKGLVPAEIALDGDATTYSALQRTFVNEPAVRHFGGEVVIDMKADDRHLLTTMKDHFFTINKQHTVVVKGKPKVTPMCEPHDCYYMSRLVNLIKSQLRGQKLLSDSQRLLKFQSMVGNVVRHYLNDQPGTHYLCEEVGYTSCQVVQFRLRNSLNWFLKSHVWKNLTQTWCGESLRVVAGYVGYLGELPAGKQFIPIATVKTKLQDNKWLGDRCVDESHKVAFRKSMEQEFDTFCEVKMAKKILRENDTQVNESAHSSQTRLNRKDINQGRCTEYPSAMAAGVLKVCLGQSYVPSLTKKLGCRIPARAVSYFQRRHHELTNKASYKKSKHGKLVRKKQRQLFNNVIKQVSTEPKALQDDYKGKGGGLFIQEDPVVEAEVEKESITVKQNQRVQKTRK